MARDALSLREARRIALAAQGFDRPRPSGRVDVRHLRRTIRQLGLLQIDSVNVLLPAHYQVPFSRLGPYELSDLDDLIYRRREFTERWAHEASILPVENCELLRLAARALGLGTASDLADYYRMPIREARQRITELVAAGELRAMRIEGWREPAYLHPVARLPRRIEAAALLSPFDPVVWYRPRAARLFQFDYRIEIYVPRAQRRWGYYVLPFLLDDRLVARVDLKADGTQRRLLVLAAYIERDAEPADVAHALAAELRTMAAWLGLESVAVARHGDLARPLAAAMHA